MINFEYLKKIAKEKKDNYAISDAALDTSLGAAVASGIYAADKKRYFYNLANKLDLDKRYRTFAYSGDKDLEKEFAKNRDFIPPSDPKVLQENQELIDKYLGKNTFGLKGSFSPDDTTMPNALRKKYPYPAKTLLTQSHTNSWEDMKRAYENDVCTSPEEIKDLLHIKNPKYSKGYIYCPTSRAEGTLEHEIGHQIAHNKNTLFSRINNTKDRFGRVLTELDSLAHPIRGWSRENPYVGKNREKAYKLSDYSHKALLGTAMLGPISIMQARTPEDVDKYKTIADLASTAALTTRISPLLPYVAHEADASYQGSKVLYNKLRAKGKGRLASGIRSLKTFRGVPTFFLGYIGAPLVTKAVSKLTNAGLAAYKKHQFGYENEDDL